MSYLFRLLCVCLASFFLLHLAVSLLVLAVAPLAARLAERMRPAAGARLLFTLRLLPLTLALAVVLGFCVPSYLRFEQDASESIGLPCLLLAASGLALLAAALLRLSSTVVLARTITPDETAAPHPLFALVGFLHPRLIVAARVRQVLSPSQLEAALLHEEAHRQSHDNLKRLAMVAAPGILPLHATFRTLERRWSRLAEWAADDAAVAAQPLRALALAEALVRVARLSSPTHTLPGVSALVDSHDDLGERIERLLQPPAPIARASSAHPRALLAGGLAIVALLLLLPHPAMLYDVHCAMEHLVH